MTLLLADGGPVGHAVPLKRDETPRWAGGTIVCKLEGGEEGQEKGGRLGGHKLSECKGRKSLFNMALNSPSFPFPSVHSMLHRLLHESQQTQLAHGLTEYTGEQVPETGGHH